MTSSKEHEWAPIPGHPDWPYMCKKCGVIRNFTNGPCPGSVKVGPKS